MRNWLIHFLSAAGAASLAALLAPAPALTQTRESRDCFDDKMVDRCDAQQQERVRRLFGLKSIEEHRDAGDQVRRVFYVEGHGFDRMAIAFVRAAGHDPAVWVHFRPGEDGRREPLTAPIPEAIWTEILLKTAYFHRELVPEPPRTDVTVVELCAHSWVFTAEAADPAANEFDRPHVRRRTEDECTDGLTTAFAWEAPRIALRLLPHCGLLEPNERSTPLERLDACSSLSGDRIAAAHVWNRMHGFEDRHGGSARYGLRHLFESGATVDWNGERNGAEDPPSFWARMLGTDEAYFYAREIEGVSASRVRVLGELRRFAGRDRQADVAPVEMIWRSRLEREFLVESATVGRWEAEP
jgi:hypothetical protein